ncbi:MAG: hypothetical protein J6S96_02500 [Muribaculaceae bacterium]|nr:hypothetical protein [Muribaculaceae bacterium]
MKRLAYILAVIVATAICVQCNSLKKIEAKAYPINYTELNNYYVRSGVVSKKIQRVVFDNETEFQQYFSEAAVMGRNDQPTPVNFKTQYVLAIILPVTDKDTQVIPAEISQVDNTVIVNYRVKKGKKLGYNIIPYTAVAIDKPEVDLEIEFNFNEL